ncbi:COX15/CtaA family protein [Bacillus alkalicola]|uniref:COX15/CtaA family protein n=1 Tax=Evansella alkalicola TaxID=745819 RepID=UPI002484C603|nr:heme A synthase [Bacillus alkalicola]
MKTFGVITSIGMVVVLIQGVLVTQTGSGDACGAEWPLCLGQIFPESPTIQTLIEYTHRVVSGLLGMMVISLAIWSWKKLSHIRETRFFAIVAILFIVFQGLLGAAAVVWGQSDAIMALHFGFSLISLTSVVLLTCLAFENNISKLLVRPTMSRAMANYIYFVLVYVYFVVYTGAYVKHTESSAACVGWPLCNGQIIPSLSDPQIAVQFGHRVAAASLFIVILAWYIQLWRNYRGQKLLHYVGLISLLFITTQVISGAVVVFSGYTLAASMFHAIFISLLFTVVSYGALLAFRSNQE